MSDFRKSVEFVITKAEAHVVTGIAYRADAPPDAQGDSCSLRELEAMAFDYLDRPVLKLMHEESLQGRARVIESWVTRNDTRIGNRVAPKGSWLVSVAIEDPAVWKLVEQGRLTGLSIMGRCRKDDAGRMVDVVVDEISLVDRPANLEPFLLAKRNGNDLTPDLGRAILEFCERAERELEQHQRDEAISKEVLGGSTTLDGERYSASDKDVVERRINEHNQQVYDRWLGKGKRK